MQQACHDGCGARVKSGKDVSDLDDMDFIGLPAFAELPFMVFVGKLPGLFDQGQIFRLPDVRLYIGKALLECH